MVGPGEPTVERPSVADLQEVSALLVRAFVDDPVVAWLIPHPGRRREVISGRFGLVVRALLERGEPYLLSDRSAAALWLAPGSRLVAPEDAADFIRRMERATGDAAPRFVQLDSAKRDHHPTEPCWFLALMGVDPDRRGQGLGTSLLGPVLERCDSEGSPAYLEATSPGSHRLYERHGFETVAEIRLPAGPPLWSMWRQPRS